MNAQVSIKGLKILNSRIEDLPKELAKSAERAVLSAGGKPILKAAIAKAPTGTGKHSGLLKKSLGLKVKRTKGVWTCRIGPRHGFAKHIGTVKRRKAAYAKTRRHGTILVGGVGSEKEVFKNPVKYSHLLEFGTSHSSAKPFIRPAMDSASSEVLKAMAEGLDKHLTRTVARLRRKAGME